MDRAEQVERNFKAFQKKLPELLPAFAGKVAVIHNEEVIDFFDTFADAVKFGEQRYGGLEAFSVQEVASPIQSLGYYSYAVGDVQQ